MKHLREIAKEPINVAPNHCELQATGRVMVEARIVINGVVQPVPPVWLIGETQKQQKKDEH